MASGAASEEDRIGMIQYILEKPATFIGPTFRHTQKLWVWNSEKGKMVERTMTYVPGILKMFDEILLNSAENRVRDPSMSKIDVSIDFDNNKITVCNDGEGVPVEKDDQGVYVPENMFYSIPASFNSENQYKITGVKLANIFSTEFEIEISDRKNDKLYKQVFRKNMMEKYDPEETPLSTKSRKRNTISFKPELAIFGMERLQGDDVVDLMRSRVHEVAWFWGNDVKVTLEGENIPVGSFKEYVAKYFLDSDSSPRVLAEKIGGGQWDVCLSLSEGQFQQVSFVNSVATIRGGSHVDYVTDLITQHVVDLANKQKIKKSKGTKLETHHVKAHLRVFVNARIDKPDFESMKKETLDLPRDKLEKIVVDDILLNKDKVSSALLKKLVSRASTHNNGVGRTEVGTWEDAYNARMHISNDCILIMTEGKSAKSLAMAGLCALSDVERDKYGIFPLSGKIPNVRDKAKRNSKLINDLKTVLGLGDGMRMRYKRILIMTDQDADGRHIKGLIINLFHTLWPSLLEQVTPPFISDFITPLITATPLDGDKDKSKTEYFYSWDDYNIWEKKEKQGKDKLTEWTRQHYKGLGAFTSEDGKDLFSRLSKQQRFFVLGEVKDDDYKAIEDAFNTNSQPRKDSINKAVLEIWSKIRSPFIFMVYIL